MLESLLVSACVVLVCGTIVIAASDVARVTNMYSSVLILPLFYHHFRKKFVEHVNQSVG